MAQTTAEIIKTGIAQTQDKETIMDVRLPEWLPVGSDYYSGVHLRDWFNELTTDEQTAVLQKAIAQVIIDLRAQARGNGKQTRLTDGQAQKRVDGYRLKPQEEPKGTSKKQKQTLPEVIAELREAGKSETEIIELVTKIVSGR